MILSLTYFFALSREWLMACLKLTPQVNEIEICEHALGGSDPQVTMYSHVTISPYKGHKLFLSPYSFNTC